MDEKCENVGVMFYTWMKLFAAILKFALVYTALQIIIFFVMVNCYSTYPGGQATSYGSHKIVILSWTACFGKGLSALEKHWSKKIQKSNIFKF